jgi:tetratricopeptide (TPR) repeat protein
MKGKGQRELDALLGVPEHSRDRATRAEIEPMGLGGHLVGGGHSPSRTARQQPVVPLPSVLARLEQGPFVGRAAALRRLRRQWERSRRDGGLVVLAGEPGVGKTRLAARIAAGAHADGHVVLYGRADEESVSPYQPFVEALRHYAAYRPGLAAEMRLPTAAARQLASMVPELGVSAAPSHRRGAHERERSRHELFDAFVRLLLHASESQRLMLVLEDLHWADVPTLLLLRELVRREAGLPLLVIATYSDLEANASERLTRVLADLRRETGTETIHLGGLPPSETAALVAAHLGRESADRAMAQGLFDQTAGNPLFIEELLHSNVPAEPAGLPEGVKDVIGRRLDRLSPATLETLTLAAVLGSDFRLATLEAVSPEQSQQEIVAALEAAVAARLIVEDPDEVDRFSFKHALVRQTLYERPIASRRLRLHRSVAVAMEAAPLPVHPAELAHHYFQAREVGGAAKAIVYCLKAAEASQATHSYEEVVAHYERALTALDIVKRDDAAARCDVLLALGAARWQASEPDPRSTFMEAVELARRLPLSERLARAALGAGGRFYAPGATDHAYIELLEEALAALEPGDSVLRVRVLARLAEKKVFAVPVERAGELAAEAVEMARRLGEAGALAAALMARHAALLYAGHAQERRRVGERALALAGELEAHELAALARHWLLYDLAELGDLEQVRLEHAELERVAEDLQQPLHRHSSLAWRCVWTGLAGRFEEAEAVAHECLGLAEHAGDAEARAHFTAQLVAVRREQGRLHELLPEIERLAGDEPAAAAWRSLLPLAYLDAGERTHAQAAYDRALGDGVDKMPRTMLWLTAMGSLADAAAELADRDGSEQLYAELERYADRLIQWSFTGNAGSVHRLLGRTAAVAGRHDEARVHFEAALERHAAIGAAPLLARTRCDYGEILLRGTPADRRRARGLLRDAGVAARRFGMVGIAARAGADRDREAGRCSS